MTCHFIVIKETIVFFGLLINEEVNYIMCL